MSTKFWDPRLVLDVYPLHDKFSCTGTTKRGLRCGQTFIDMKYESDQILEVFSSKDVVTYGLDETMKLSLRALAKQTLCPRWHRNGYQSQTNDIYLKWCRTINNFVIEERSKIQLIFEQRRRPVPTPELVREASAVSVVPHDTAALQPEPARELRPISVANEGSPRQPIEVVSSHSLLLCDPS
jgi:hypothetical protein